jgi:hypothetical protein
LPAVGSVKTRFSTALAPTGWATAIRAVPCLASTGISTRLRWAGAKAPNEREALQRQIAATDAQIDALVYELYGLTDEEIRIVEEATPAV